MRKTESVIIKKNVLAIKKIFNIDCKCGNDNTIKKRHENSQNI